MQVTLSPHAEQLLRDQLARSGRSPEEVVERALEILHSEDDWLVENRGTIDSKIRRGLEELGWFAWTRNDGNRHCPSL